MSASKLKTDNPATAEDYLAATFDAEPDIDTPTWDEFESRAKLDFPDVVRSCAIFESSNTELAKRIRENGGLEEWGKLFESLNEMEQRYRDNADHLKAAAGRLLVAMTQTHRDDVGHDQYLRNDALAADMVRRGGTC